MSNQWLREMPLREDDYAEDECPPLTLDQFWAKFEEYRP